MDDHGNTTQIASQHYLEMRLEHMEPQYFVAKKQDSLNLRDSEDPKTLIQDRNQAPLVGESPWGHGDHLQSATLSQAHVVMGVSVSAGPPSLSAGGARALLLQSGGRSCRDLKNTAQSFAQQHLICVPALNINMKLCLACASDKVVTQHPLFHGGLCRSCKVNYILSVYLFDGGYHSYCAVCGRGEEILLCESSNCWRVFCTCCMDRLLGLGTARRAKASPLWQCYLCRPLKAGSPLSLRHDWALRLRDLIVDEAAIAEESEPLHPPLAPTKKAKVSVVTLFDDPSAATNTLSELKDLMACHVMCSLSKNRTKVAPTMERGKHIHTDVSTITGKHVKQWGPFTLVLGGHCLLDSGTGETLNHFFYEFFHLLQMTRPRAHEACARPFFWLLTVLEAKCFCGPMNSEEISRFLAMPPVKIISSHKQVTCYMWGNLPCLNKICDFYRDVELEPVEAWQVKLGKNWYLAYSAVRRALAPLRDYFRFE